MKNNSILKIVLISIILGGTIFWFLGSDSNLDQANQNQDRHGHQDNHHHDKDEDHKDVDAKKEKMASSKSSNESQNKISAPEKGTIEKKEFIPQNKDEEALLRLNQTVAKVFENKEDPREFISFLEENELAPEQSVSSNEYTGTMIMIRSGKGLPGTRYYHAQYMGDNPDSTFLQHLSYQYRPGPDSLPRSIQAAEATYNVQNKKVYRDGNFITYDIGEEGTHQLSIEKAKYENLKDDPYNAYTPEDDGVVITRIELKIHDDNEGVDEHIDHNH
ncbi:MAG: hypothetical protein CME63_11430 [Halobacteriovoraceae bacterium]|nr:hypothetical protein [Halobacteriovoraceae bacterium]MBC98355.1 hypothetical protein [Halobacteriovoraceae bacterium]|tara:strand:- start:2761 stop:3582 length:822 start_codon:yes stop_codon:yes gene_type:complete